MFLMSSIVAINDAKVNVLKNQVRSKASNFTREIITCDLKDDDKTVVENNIDIQWENSEITQKTY